MANIQKGELPYGHFFKMISGKWKPYILVAIDYEGSIRFNSILKQWGEISSKVLYQTLRELEEDQLIYRVSDPDRKQHVEYHLTENGRRIMSVIKEIYKYSIDDMIEKDILIDSRAFDYYNPARRKEEAKKTEKLVAVQA
jgi:DNA-binding HxlR family transcriptional regulator